MSCRVGITTDTDRRKAEWKRKFPNMSAWRVIGTYYSKSKAQEKETEYANQNKCEASPGGAGDEYGTWYVYRFTF